jgi:hypothetical protein
MTARWNPTPRTEPPPPAGTVPRPFDPAFVWAVHTQWRGFARHAAWTGDNAGARDGDLVQILVRADSAAHAKALLAIDWLQVATMYPRPQPGQSNPEPFLHFTARVSREHLARLANGGLPAEWELSLPLRDAERVARGSALGRYGPSRALVSFQATNVLKEAVGRVDKAESGKLNDVIAVIDFGCPFLNRQYFEPSGPRTRLVALWDQGSEVREFEAPPADTDEQEGWPWTAPKHAGYGRQIGPEVLQAMVDAVCNSSPSLDEGRVYRGVDYLIDYDDPRRRIWQATHGAHVLDVAGGVIDPLTGEPDAASQAHLMFVQLPALTAADSAGGSLAGHVLDGVHYVLDRCVDQARAVISISYGNRGGPHDGTSFLETALDELLHRRGHDVAIVLAAGNSRRQAAHARRQAAADRSALFNVWLTPGDSTDTFVELWYAPPPEGWALQARVRSPDRQWSPRVMPGQEALQRDDGRSVDVVAMLRHEVAVRRRLKPPRRADEAVAFEDVPRGLVVLVTAPTAPPPGVPCALAEPGRWEIEVELVRTTAPVDAASPVVDINGWIERDDPGETAAAGESHFLDQDSDDDRDTLSSLANGQFTIVAGGFRRSDGREADYSSVGPRRRGGPLPQVLAVCEEDELQPDIRATAVRSGEAHRMNGTSVAAPVLARRLYNWLAGRRGESEAPPTLQEWAAALQRLAKDRDGVRPLPDD